MLVVIAYFSLQERFLAPARPPLSPFFKGKIFSVGQRPLWKRGEGEIFWTERGGNYVANFWNGTLDAFVTKIGEDKPVAFDNLAQPNRHCTVEHRAVVSKRVELAALTTMIGAGRQVGKKSCIKLSADK